MQTCGGATGADTNPRGRLRGTKDTDDAYWAHGYSGSRIEDRGGGGDAGPGPKPISHRDTRDELGMGYLGEFYDDAMH